MRKEVKIGTAIGGVLVAVIVVSALVNKGNSKKHDAVVLDTGKPAAGTGDQTGTPDHTPAGDPASVARPADPVPPSHDTTGDAPAGGQVTPPAAPTHPDDSADASHSPKSGTNWQILLSAEHPDEIMTPVHTNTPDPAGSGGTPTPPTETRVDTGSNSSGGTSAPPTGTSGSGTGVASDPVSPVTPHPAGPQTHRIQSGETFSSIAKSFYGDARFFGEIAKANPTVNPNKLKPGTTINLPDKAMFKTEKKEATAGTSTPAGPAATPHPTAPAVSAAVDPKTEYRVQSTDSLYKISMKLYGTPNKVDAIYQLNKDRIGADPARLKLNMVLKLPETPNSSASTSATASR
ncbi:MAG TPA: LysM peptidoglycan-binding domain-containing protein [Tepidisphaeraceae bacterium]|jgi:nucleoid-associated protein YgaU|nr:LysM peptidoglycan-binding domain-containing protein [Tepidisphaeraceae bacterium]